MEGEGLRPQIETEQTIEDFMAGRDTVLDVALEYLGD